MDLSDSILGSDIHDKTKLVKGCPCYREFGEPVCLNNDDVLPINAISVDPSFFQTASSNKDLQELKSDNEGMCYLLIFLDRKEGYCYCVSQNKRLSIDGKDVRVSDIDSALHFVTNTEKMSDGLLCSECLYKYLRTLGDASEGYFTDSEREEVLAQYIKEVGYKMASELSGAVIADPSSISNEQKQPIIDHIQKVGKTRSRWASVLMSLKRKGANRKVLDLIDHYRTLHRLEAIFLNQVLNLDQPSEHETPSSLLRYMLGTAEKLVSITGIIRSQTKKLIENKTINGELQEILLQNAEKRQRTEEKFRGLASVLSEISNRTTS